MTHLSLVGEEQSGLCPGAEEATQEGEVDDGDESGKVDVGGQVDEAKAVGEAAEHPEAPRRLHKVEHQEEGHVLVERRLVRHGQGVPA